MAGYTRQSTFADGDIIQASDFNDEYNQLVNVFSNTTGHAHDGTAAEGPVIGLIGDPGVATPLNKVVVDDTNNRVGLFIDAGGLGSSVEQLRFQDGVIIPVTNNDIDLGSSSLRFKDGYFAGNVTAANISSTAFNGDILPDADNTRDLGSTTLEWKDLYIDGVAYLDSISMPTTTVTDILDEDTMVSDSATALATQQSIKAYVDAQVTAQDLDVAADTGTAAIDLDSQSFTVAGTANEIETSATGQTVTIGLPNNVTIGNNLTVTNDATVTGVLTVNGNTTLGNAATDTVTITADVASNILPSVDDTYDLGATGAEWKDIYIDGVAYVDSIAMPTTTVTDILDEDTMSSDSATALATQQSIKAYVDAQITANNELNEITDVTITSVADNEVLAYDSTSGDWINQTAAEAGLVTLTGTETLTNKTLTTPIIAAISNTGTITLPTSTDTLVGRATTDTLTNKTLTSAVLNTGVSGTAVLDEDTMVSDSATQLATQQSIKAYVDAQVGGAGTLNNVVDDTTPQLGGNLDVNGQSIVSVSAGNISITPDTTGSVIIDGLSHPQADGTTGQFLKTDGAGQLAFATVTQATGNELENVVEDLTPQLGGNLDVNGQSIVSVSNGNINVAPNGTGSVIIDGLSYPKSDGTNGQVLTTNGSGTLSFQNVTETDPSALAFAIALG
jgi:hypothetical protein